MADIWTIQAISLHVFLLTFCSNHVSSCQSLERKKRISTELKFPLVTSGSVSGIKTGFLPLKLCNYTCIIFFIYETCLFQSWTVSSIYFPWSFKQVSKLDKHFELFLFLLLKYIHFSSYINAYCDGLLLQNVENTLPSVLVL